jgi:hypothetical protein
MEENQHHMARSGMSGGIFILALIAVSLLLSAASALAHDSRPAYLELVETDVAVFELSWKRPLYGGRDPAMELALPSACRDVVPAVCLEDDPSGELQCLISRTNFKR